MEMAFLRTPDPVGLGFKIRFEWEMGIGMG